MLLLMWRCDPGSDPFRDRNFVQISGQLRPARIGCFKRGGAAREREPVIGWGSDNGTPFAHSLRFALVGVTSNDAAYLLPAMDRSIDMVTVQGRNEVQDERASSEEIDENIPLSERGKSEEMPLERRSPGAVFGLVGLSYLIVLALAALGVALWLWL